MPGSDYQPITPGGGGAATVSHPYLSLPDGWDTGWKGAKAAQASTPTWITVLGDSICTGNNTSDPMTKAWFYQLRASLSATLPVYADCYGPGMQAFSVGVSSPPSGYPLTLNGTQISTSNGYGTALRCDTGQTLTFTSQYACTAIDLIMVPSFAGSWNYTIDGGAPVTITNATSSQMNRIQLRGLANTVHTIVFDTVTSIAAFIIAAIITYKSLTSGIGYCNMAVGGAQSTGYLTNASPPKAIYGTTNNTFTTTGFGIPSQASLWFLVYGINDLVSGGIRPAQFKYCWATIVQLIRKSVPTASIVMLIPSNPRTYSDAGSCFTNSDYWDDYKEAYYAIAREYTCAVVDIDAKWGASPVAKGFLTVGQGHPIDAGQTDMANTILGVL